MGYSKLDYFGYLENESFWRSKSVSLPLWVSEVVDLGGEPVCAIDFYDDIFGDDLEESRVPEDYVNGEYGAIALEITYKDGKKKGNRVTVTQGNMELYDLIDRSENFCLLSPISYAGKNRTIKNARFLYALTIEIDNIKGESGIRELFYSWERNVATLPKPTYVVCSGGGVHLYFVFDRPIPLYSNLFEQLSDIKNHLTPKYWNPYVTTMNSSKDIQFESLNQPFRIVGTKTKKDAYAMAFKVGEKIAIEYLNSFLPSELQMDRIYKSKLPLEKAKELYPKWYQRRIVEGSSCGHWNRHKPIYFDWIKKIYDGAEVGHRYNCLENLCSLAVQCNIEPGQVEKDCREVAEYLEQLTNSEDNHFTEYDILCALRTYHNADESAYRRRIDFISKKTGITLTPNKRRKKPLCRDDGTALKAARMIQDLQDPDGEWRNKSGRPIGTNKSMLISEWRRNNPNGKKIECERALGLSRHTVLKWWDSSLSVSGDEVNE